ncbi:hypothetical protein BDV25DRAFT_10298 [Aspergillus avenaceus]|uniref:Uncharacterized protein n=1 Tax=Aspergillus avenaceus TaxID=36643 RepID=A0A5N6TRA9_ASPAV|nr:hypothetical protein BDV25DRAFT_10298 [Aspergillus avenaceus]
MMASSSSSSSSSSPSPISSGDQHTKDSIQPPSAPQTTISDLKDSTISPDLWYRIHVLIFDLCNFSKSASRDRLESVIDPSYIGKPHFSPEEAEKIKGTVIGTGGRTFSQAMEEGLNERLERRSKKRIESGDFRVCAAHDLAPLMGRALGIDLKQMKMDKQFAKLVEENGINLNGRTWGGLKKKTFAPRRKK